MSEYQGDLASCGSAHPQRQGGRRGQPEPERGNLGPREASSTKLQAGPRLLTRTSWDSGRLTSTGRGAVRDQLRRRDTAHLSRPCPLPPRKPSGWDGEVMRRTPHLGRLCWPSPWSPEPLGPGRQTPQAQLILLLCGVPKSLNLSGSDWGSARNPGPASDSSPAEEPRASEVETGKAHLP